MNLRSIVSAALVLSLGTFAGACSKKKDDAAQGAIRVAIKPTGNPAAASLLDATAGDFRNTSIASGAPESLTLYIKSMSLKTSDGKSKTIFSDAAGKPIVVGSKSVDISALFTNYACVDSQGVPVTTVTSCPCGLDSNNAAVAQNADGSCPDSGQGAVGVTQVEEGTFSSLDVEFLVAAKVKGCVTGNFGSADSVGTATQGLHTYCTKASASTFQTPPGVATAAELEGTLATAEAMDYQIFRYQGLFSSATQSQSLSFPIKDNVTISKDSTTPPTLTMMIDTNRMLRFYNQNKIQSPNPGMASDRSYFFSTVFENSAFVFVGTPGDIRGYQWWTEGCSNNPSGGDCGTQQTSIVAGWMTIIKDKDQKPLIVGLMPDDDNTLTVIKGSNIDMSGIDTSKFVANGTNLDISYGLDASNTGVLKNVNIDADLDSTQTTSFVGFQNFGGKLYIKRQL